MSVLDQSRIAVSPRFVKRVAAMNTAEDRSWEYTLGRIDERTENIEKRLTRVEAEVTEVKDVMLTKSTFFTVLGIVASIIVAFLIYIVSNLD